MRPSCASSSQSESRFESNSLPYVSSVLFETEFPKNPDLSKVFLFAVLGNTFPLSVSFLSYINGAIPSIWLVNMSAETSDSGEVIDAEVSLLSLKSWSKGFSNYKIFVYRFQKFWLKLKLYAAHLSDLFIFNFLGLPKFRYLSADL